MNLDLQDTVIGYDNNQISGDRILTNDPNPEFQDVTQAVRKFDEMRITSAKARASSRLLTAPALQLVNDMWVETEKEVVKPKHKKIEEYVKGAILDPPSKRFPKQLNFRQLIEDMYLSICYGFFDFEINVSTNDKGEYYYKDIAPRHPMSIAGWKKDKQAKITGFYQSQPRGSE